MPISLLILITFSKTREIKNRFTSAKWFWVVDLLMSLVFHASSTGAVMDDIVQRSILWLPYAEHVRSAQTRDVPVNEDIRGYLTGELTYLEAVIAMNYGVYTEIPLDRVMFLYGAVFGVHLEMVSLQERTREITHQNVSRVAMRLAMWKSLRFYVAMFEDDFVLEHSMQVSPGLTRGLFDTRCMVKIVDETTAVEDFSKPPGSRPPYLAYSVMGCMRPHEKLSFPHSALRPAPEVPTSEPPSIQQV